MADFRTALRDHRTALLLTQNQYAKRIGASPAAITAWESGARSPGFAMARRLVADGIDHAIVLETVRGQDKGAAA